MSVREGRRSCFATLAAGAHAPGLIAYLADHPVGWISIGPRSDYPRVAMSRATPPVDDARVWIIPCLLVRREYRGQGITRALIAAAAHYASEWGAEALEAYPRPDEDRPSPSAAFIGTVGLFKNSGFTVVRGPAWTPEGLGPALRDAPDAGLTASATSPSGRDLAPWVKLDGGVSGSGSLHRHNLRD